VPVNLENLDIGRATAAATRSTTPSPRRASDQLTEARPICQYRIDVRPAARRPRWRGATLTKATMSANGPPRRRRPAFFDHGRRVRARSHSALLALGL